MSGAVIFLYVFVAFTGKTLPSTFFVTNLSVVYGI
jgi:hypothetical protein